MACVIRTLAQKKHFIRTSFYNPFSSRLRRRLARTNGSVLKELVAERNKLVPRDKELELREWPGMFGATTLVLNVHLSFVKTPSVLLNSSLGLRPCFYLSTGSCRRVCEHSEEEVSSHCIFGRNRCVCHAVDLGRMRKLRAFRYLRSHRTSESKTRRCFHAHFFFSRRSRVYANECRTQGKHEPKKEERKD